MRARASFVKKTRSRPHRVCPPSRQMSADRPQQHQQTEEEEYQPAYVYALCRETGSWRFEEVRARRGCNLVPLEVWDGRYLAARACYTREEAARMSAEMCRASLEQRLVDGPDLYAVFDRRAGAARDERGRMEACVTVWKPPLVPAVIEVMPPGEAPPFTLQEADLTYWQLRREIWKRLGLGEKGPELAVEARTQDLNLIEFAVPEAAR